ncbi:Txe/YoeB family addiction module toxin [Aphanothece sacrum]|uniref:Endoribonuclease YoeB n=1 Tax=Aphanothece sacrum FPU1 TaxID=1920663 RepID=A0A401ICN1_APHSA|nr:Txe/YoeB family addiction module toxin [Aphanothece sacrum]GBF78939.1 addiction module protein [Aphanothece sacrum FPU1]GBF86713.1 addiction module toxin [Aphanothece sacrum FPU3]
MRKIAFLARGFDEFNKWAVEDKKIYAKILTLIKDIQRDPFSGLGKPEALKYELSGLWSRRITDEHRLVYSITDEDVIIVSCRFHY